jgi:hypothetical protein
MNVITTPTTAGNEKLPTDVILQQYTPMNLIFVLILLFALLIGVGAGIAQLV